MNPNIVIKLTVARRGGEFFQYLIRIDQNDLPEDVLEHPESESSYNYLSQILPDHWVEGTRQGQVIRVEITDYTDVLIVA